MPQRTRETVAGRVWTFASRTGDQASRVIAVVVPQRTRTRAPSNGLARMMMGTKGTATGKRLIRGTVPMVRLAWRSGKATGRAQGMATLAPAAMRGWWAEMTRQVPGRRTTRRARRIAVWTPVALGATQVAARAWMQMQRNANRLRARQRTWTTRLPLRVGRMVGTTKGARGLARVSESRAVRRAQATMKTARGTGKTFALTVRTRGRARLRRGWRRVRFFTIGFSIGAIWAYLFAPRQGPAYERMQQATQRTRTA